MKYKSSSARGLAAVAIVFCLLLAPVAVLAKKGEKNYNRGINYEKMQQWERAAQEFALAVAANPADIEYQLHYRRAVFNASQRFMEQGRSLAEQGDYTGAYNAFRQAYGYDPINELAASEMERMLRLQREKEASRNTNGGSKGNNNGGAPAAPSHGVGGPTASAGSVPTVPATYRTGGAAQGPAVGRSEQQRVVNYSGDLENYIRQLAEELNLNVIFDRDFPKRTINIHLREVTTARVLDYIFTAQNIFFQKLDRRTILVADASKRPQYQQLVLRTFYLSNTDPNDARSLIQSALPPNAGRQPQVVPNKQTNSITVRDTPENIALIAQLLNSVDKDRAEVVMDVNIYEVSRNNLLQIGNQLGDQSSLTSGLGGLLTSTFPFGSRQDRITGATTGGGKGTGTTTGTIIPNVIGGALLLPASSVSLFQSKDNTRLLASTQVHAFDDEQSTTRIGQKVPVQTAAVTPYLGTGTNTTTNGSPATSGLFGGGYPVIQYQDTGLILKFQPKVYPNQDVEVKMEIESNDVIGGASNLTPTFSQRSITGKARIPNNRTMMIASVAQDKHADGRRGLPVLGLIPLLGRLFATPTNSDSNSDVVVTVTPRVLRAPTVTPADLEMRESGTLQSPTSQSLEALLIEADREDQLAAARELPTNTQVEVPTAAAVAAATATVVVHTDDPEPPPSFVPAPTALTPAALALAANGGAVNFAPASANLVAPQLVTPVMYADTTQTTKPAPAALTNMTQPAVNTNAAQVGSNASAAQPVPAVENRVASAAAASAVAPGGAALMLISNQTEMRVGERQKLLVLVKTGTPLNLAATTLRFDPRLFAVRSVSKGNMFEGTNGAATLTQSIDPTGALLAVIAPAAGTQINGMGVLLIVEVEALAPGAGDIGFDQAGVHFMTADGRGLAPQLAQAHFVVKK
jgi:general secretion pathway protein D